PPGPWGAPRRIQARHPARFRPFKCATRGTRRRRRVIVHTPRAKMSLPSEGDSTGRSFGDEELALLKQVITSGTLNCTRGMFVREFEKRFAAWLGLPFCRTTTSGTAAVHTAVAAVDPEPGDEIITTPVTDMRGITPTL